MGVPRYINDKTIVKKRLMDLSQTMIETLTSEPAVLRLDKEPIMIVGDIHADLNSLKVILEQREKL